MEEQGRKRKMVITIDIDTGDVDSVTDEKGDEAESSKTIELNGHQTIEVPKYTFIRTHSSPGCGWYWTGSRWYWICV
jgi:hypothetical protein